MACRHFLVAILRSATGEGRSGMVLNSSISQRGCRINGEVTRDQGLAVGKPSVNLC